MKTVDITITQGALQAIDLPPGVRAIVRDYDIEGGTRDGFDIRKDGNGAEYHRMEYESKEDNSEGSDLLLIDVGNIDWAMLRAQKETLLQARDRLLSGCVESPCADALTGLLHLIDHVQDEAVHTIGEQAIFGDGQQSVDIINMKGK